MDTISTGFICRYGTTGPVFSSAAQPGTIGTTWKRQVENAGIEPATASGVLTTKPFPSSAVHHTDPPPLPPPLAQRAAFREEASVIDDAKKGRLTAIRREKDRQIHKRVMDRCLLWNKGDIPEGRLSRRGMKKIGWKDWPRNYWWTDRRGLQAEMSRMVGQTTKIRHSQTKYIENSINTQKERNREADRTCEFRDRWWTGGGVRGASRRVCGWQWGQVAAFCEGNGTGAKWCGASPEPQVGCLAKKNNLENRNEKNQ